jgi:predicted DNA-binding transcriptional regulator AlpA
MHYHNNNDGTVSRVNAGLLNESDVARITRMSLASVRRWRLVGDGPRFLKINSAVRYRPTDLEAWLQTRPSGGSQSAEGR